MTFESLAADLDRLGGQLAALEATKGTALPAVDTRGANNTEGFPTELRDALAPLQAQLRIALTAVQEQPTTYGRLFPTILTLSERILALIASRYPSARPTIPSQAEVAKLARKLAGALAITPAVDGRV